MYYFIRYGIIVLIAVVCFAIYYLFKIRNIHVIRSMIMIALVCSLFVYFFSFENLFYRFKTPESAYEYVSNDSIVNILDYDNYAAIVHKKNNGTPQFSILREDSRGWLIANPSMVSAGKSLFVNNNFIDYSYIDEGDIFIRISIPVSDGSELPVVYDSNNTQFELLSTVGDHGGFKIYYAFTKYKEGYSITINDNITPIS